MQLVILVLLVYATLSSIGNCACDDPDNLNFATLCSDVFKSLEQSLIRNEGNIYRIRKAFYYAPSADPVLLKVTYYVSYNTTNVLPYCVDVQDNSTAIPMNETKIVHGWTSRGVYYVINPLVLNYMQMTLPFAILRLIHTKLDLDDNSPEVDTFLWDGSYDLPTLYIDLSQTLLPCIPSVENFNSTLKDLTAFLKDYASHNLVSDTIHAEALAFALSEERISSNPTYDLKDQSGYMVYYCFLGFFFVFLSSLNIVFNSEFIQSVHSMIKDKLSSYSELVAAIIILGLFIIFSEFVATCVLLHHSRYFGAITHMFVWMSTIFIYVIMHPIYYYSNKKHHHVHKNSNANFLPFFITFTMVLFGLHLYFYALPAFLLLLVYPTKVIATAAYMIAFVTATSIIGSMFILMCKFFFKRMFSNFNRKYTCFHVTMIALLLANVFLMFLMPIVLFGALIQLVYALVLGQASAITAGPYTIISLIPSIAITLLSWMIKKKLFGGKKKENGSKDDNTEPSDSASSQSKKSKVQEGKQALLLVNLNDDSHHKASGSKSIQDYGGTT